MSKIKFELEFPIHASPKMLYQYFATPSGLSEWFADNVNSTRCFVYFYLGRHRRSCQIVAK